MNLKRVFLGHRKPSGRVGMSYYTISISTIQDLENLAVFQGSTVQYGISNVLFNSSPTAPPTQFWYPISTPTANFYQIQFTSPNANPTNFRLWANGGPTQSTAMLPNIVALLAGNISVVSDSTPVWQPYYLNNNINTPYGFVYENAIGNGNLSNISSYNLLYNYNDNGSNDPSTFAIRLYSLEVTGFLPPPVPEPSKPPVQQVVCNPRYSGPGAIPESMLLARKALNCTVVNSAMAQQLVNSQLRGVPSSVRTAKIQQTTLDCYAPITDPLRREALYQGPVIPPACPPTPAEQLNSTRPKVSQAGTCLQEVPFYQRPPK